MGVVNRHSFGRKIYDRYTSLVGDVLSLVSPKRASAFVSGRMGYREFVAGSLKDADRKFLPRTTSGDAAVKRSLKIATARCRDQAENNPLISGAIDRVCNNVVRSGIYPKFKFRTRDEKLDTIVNARWRRLFLRWIRYCDITGHDFYGALQRLGLRHMWTDGGFLVHRVYDDSLRGIVPLRLELLELDMLDPLVDGVLPNGNIARRGIEYDQATGCEVMFHILDQHPGDYIATGRRTESRQIPASEIIHVWDRRRISQYGGIGWLVAVVMEAFRMEDFRHITQDAARLQSVFVAFLESAYPGFQLGGGLSFGGQTSSSFTPADTGTTTAPKEIQSNIIQPVPSGTRVNMNSPVQPGNNYEPFVKDSQRWQSAGIGMSFEAYANNYTDASYASSRSGSLEERLSYRAQQQFIDEKLNSRIVAWFIEAAYLSRLAPVQMPGYAREPHLYHEMAEGQYPGWGWVDPSNDARAAEKKVDLVIDTRRNQAAQAGNDFDEVVAEILEEEKQLLEIAEIRNKRLLLEGSETQTPGNNEGDNE